MKLNSFFLFLIKSISSGTLLPWSQFWDLFTMTLSLLQLSGDFWSLINNGFIFFNKHDIVIFLCANSFFQVLNLVKQCLFYFLIVITWWCRQWVHTIYIGALLYETLFQDKLFKFHYFRFEFSQTRLD